MHLISADMRVNGYLSVSLYGNLPAMDVFPLMHTVKLIVVPLSLHCMGFEFLSWIALRINTVMVASSNRLLVFVSSISAVGGTIIMLAARTA